MTVVFQKSLRTLAAIAFATSIAYGQTASSLDPLLQKAVDRYHQTSAEAQSYTYTERYQNINRDSSGKETLNSTDTYEIVFLEGAPYKKHTLHNDQPLSEKEQKKEDAKLKDVSAARATASGSNDKKGLFNASFRFELPLDQLATRFEVSPQADEATEDGRSIYLARPKGDMKLAAHENAAYEMKFWVNKQDGVFKKIEAKVVGEGMRYEKDSVVSYQWKKVNDEVWLPSGSTFKGKVRYMMRDVPAEAIYTYSGYKKYRVDTKVVPQ